MQTDVIIIGGGLHGCSIALHLAQQGFKPIVLEKNIVGRHASGVNAGGVRQLMRDVAEIPLSIAAMDIWENLDRLLGSHLAETCEFISRVGQVGVAASASELAWCAQRTAEMKALGYDLEEMLDAKGVRRLVPTLSDMCIGGIVSRRDGHANPFRSTQAFRARAEQLGARFYEHTCVTDVAEAGSKWQLDTTRGQMHADIVVNCGGAWAWQIAGMIGEQLPSTHLALTLMVTSRIQRFLDPVVIGIDRKLSLKQTEVGTVVIGGGVLGEPDLDAGTTLTVADRMVESARTVWDFFPILRQATIVRTWAGLEAVTPDILPIIGASSVAKNFWHVFGFSGHGFQLGPIVGSVISEMIADGKSAFSIAAFSPARFSNGAIASGAIHAAQHEQQGATG
ncbi:FAD-binding oxidoreductase [Mesorhizobium sp. M1396]|uniref:NAD(P)/FAD-dependent oxidoreductase n=1 Tax=Mesorhizobium sp. M1396 TaxID=2957095 RepID=UPI00333A7040